eukprot:Opistho-2@69823
MDVVNAQPLGGASTLMAEIPASADAAAVAAVQQQPAQPAAPTRKRKLMEAHNIGYLSKIHVSDLGLDEAPETDILERAGYSVARFEYYNVFKRIMPVRRIQHQAHGNIVEWPRSDIFRAAGIKGDNMSKLSEEDFHRRDVNGREMVTLETQGVIKLLEFARKKEKSRFKAFFDTVADVQRVRFRLREKIANKAKGDEKPSPHPLAAAQQMMGVIPQYNPGGGSFTPARPPVAAVPNLPFGIVVRRLGMRRGGHFVPVRPDTDVRDIIRMASDALKVEISQVRDAVYEAIITSTALLKEGSVVYATTEEEERKEFGVAGKK